MSRTAFFGHIAMTFVILLSVNNNNNNHHTCQLVSSTQFLNSISIKKNYYTTVYTVQYISLIYYQRIWSISLNLTETTLSLCPVRTAQSSKFIISIMHKVVFKKKSASTAFSDYQLWDTCMCSREISFEKSWNLLRNHSWHLATLHWNGGFSHILLAKKQHIT